MHCRCVSVRRDNGSMINDELSQAISNLARESGVLTEWVDAWNVSQQVSPDDLLAVLSALTGRSLDSVAAVEAVSREIAFRQPPIDPVLVAWDGVLPVVHLVFPVEDASVVLEDGSELAIDVKGQVLEFSSELPMGYHTLLVNGGSHTSHIFSAPTRAHPAPRGVTGLISPTYSMRGSMPDAGVGTVAHLRRFADLCHDAGIEVVGTLPLLASYPDQPSPYAPASRRAWNEIFVDFSSIPGWVGDAPVIASDHL